MSEQYWIGGFFIDLPRNQITQNGQTITLAPKALAVLTCLAEQQGQVVSQETLLEQVWPDTVVSPNTLQRSIAQLRKALGDDGKVQVYIKTHAKKGYSLECDVRWHSGTEGKPNTQSKTQATDTPITPSEDEKISVIAQPEIDVSTQPKAKSLPAWQLGIVAFIVLLLSVLFITNPFSSEQTPSSLTISDIRAITSTDTNEFASVYSPDGKYILFHRFSEESCVNNIWAKNIATHKEHKLTKDIDAYGKHSFSKDGKELVFIRTLDCEKPVEQRKCYQLVSLDFARSLREPQAARLLLECNNSHIKLPHWMNNNHIALLQKHAQQWKLISYSIKDKKNQTLHTVEGGNIVYFDYSKEQDLIALTSVHSDGQYYIEIITPSGEHISRALINYPDEIPPFKFMYAHFSPINDQLLFSTGMQMFSLSFDGNVSKINIPLDEPIGSPFFHPSGERALAIKGVYDSDIAAITRASLAAGDDASLKHQPRILHRSITTDGDAVLHPNQEMIAFESTRSGSEQVWLHHQDGVKKLSNFPTDAYIYGIKWAIDGNRLLVNANNQLIQLSLDGKTHTYTLPYAVLKLFSWDSESNNALALVSIKGIHRLANINLNTSSVNTVTEKRVNWAAKNKAGDVIFTDHMDRFWQVGPIEEMPIAALNGQSDNEVRFVLKENRIYGVNEQKQLWSYDFYNSTFKNLGKLPHNIDFISDINDEYVFATLRISSRKEVVELIL